MTRIVTITDANDPQYRLDVLPPRDTPNAIVSIRHDGAAQGAATVPAEALVRAAAGDQYEVLPVAALPTPDFRPGDRYVEFRSADPHLAASAWQVRDAVMHRKFAAEHLGIARALERRVDPQVVDHLATVILGHLGAPATFDRPLVERYIAALLESGAVTVTPEAGA